MQAVEGHHECTHVRRWLRWPLAGCCPPRGERVGARFIKHLLQAFLDTANSGEHATKWTIAVGVGQGVTLDRLRDATGDQEQAASKVAGRRRHTQLDRRRRPMTPCQDGLGD